MNFLLLLFLSLPVRADQSGPGNGTDYVKVLFAEAQYDAVRRLAPLDESSIADLGLPDDLRAWLLSQAQGESRFTLVKHFLRRLELRFQQQPCSDGSGKPASICYFGDRNEPWVLVSLLENKMTSSEQAVAMLIHEAGHYTGETNHLLLDRVGVALARAARVPSHLFADAESTEIVANPFQAKIECESGASSQARSLMGSARVSLLGQCTTRGLECPEARISYFYAGENLFKDGIGFEMKVRCRVRAVLRLR